ncbi:thyroid receptor-interacting protein 11 [Cololabis saira]|uniref:thyroid receptor-interacting protein 11 n=1 Tax=Cololabis saira TaxID=129043 RepID=UPI002AD2BF41|nr:thyroid receptor-interacting protein 11 [Cololabis saira]
MSSWLGGIGSGLGGSLSSFTGQISSFTKDMLLEGMEEVGDAATELQVSNSKLADVETAFTSQKSEYDRMKKLHAELEEKLEAAEIQMKQQSAENRTLLQQKDVEISHLKARQSGLQEEVQKLQRSAGGVGGAVTTSTSSLGRHPGAQGYHGDDVDISEVLWSQQEINRLSTEVLRLEAESEHWRRVSQASAAPGAGGGDQGEVVKLQRSVQELRDQMSREVDEHQHELAALQDAQRQKLADVSRRHRQELAEYEERIEELEEQIHAGEAPASSSPDASRVPELQSGLQQLQQLQQAAEQQRLQLAELTASLEEAQQSRAQLQREKDEVQQENGELLQNYSRLQASVAELQKRVEEQEGRALEKAQLEQEIQRLRGSLAAAETEVRTLRSLTETEPREEVEHADILELNTIIGTLRREKDELEQEKLNLQQKLKETEEQTVGDKREDESVEDLKEELERRGKALRATESERDTLMSELEELDQQNQEATQHMISVKEQLSGQLKETEAELRRTAAELETARDQSRTLERDLGAQREKTSHSAFTLNDLHMGKQELERALKELREELGRAREQGRAARAEAEENRASLSRTLREKDTRIEALKLEKEQLEGELSRAERTVAEQVKQYQQTLEELSRARSMDASTLQTEHESAIRLNQDKDLEISRLRRDLEQLASDQRDTNEMLAITVAGQQQLTDLLQEKDAFAETLKQNAADLQAELEAGLAAATGDAEALRRTLEDKDRQLGGMKEDNSHLKEEIDRLRDQQSRPPPPAEPKTLDIITELETEIGQLKEEVRTLRRDNEEQQQDRQARQGELEQTQQLIQARDQEISRLQQLDRDRDRADSPDVILQEDKTRSLNRDDGGEKQDLSKVELQRLVLGLREKEAELLQLKERNTALAQQLDLQLEQLAPARGEAGRLSQLLRQRELELQALQARAATAGLEREQMLAVLNEKTRENSQLRSDVHRLVDAVAGKEAALTRLQQEAQRLSHRGDPAGSQDMFKETIQNLSRIIREKDMEIDALTQKCQTLVAVLQASGGEAGGAGGGVISSNQFEELLHERNALKQQVKKVEEWKQQVITTVKNMQQEAAQLQEELLRLQGQVSADSDCSSQLSVDYARLVQSYELKERWLGGLSAELAQLQQSIGQLSCTREELLGRLDAAAGGTEAPPLPGGQAPPPQAQPDGDPARLRAQLAERDQLIRTLQENNQRLSDQAEEVQQVRVRLEDLQRSVRDKDLLIKTKGDQLLQVSEALRGRDGDNEVLKQAATNLRERALQLEQDGKALKEENERVAARSREKESEFRALQETNMQVSLLLREKEFQLSTVGEKAATLERMLQDKEQGKSGELNQLLNELKSMQDKAVLFQQERDQVMMALKQKQMETTAVQSELQHTKDKEQRLNLELERLRNHLLEIEDSYTREALAAEDRETELRRRVAMLDERLATSSSAVENASQQASMQVESLQEQLTGAVKQRDDALAQLRTSQEQVNQYAVSLSNLQMVLEQFQQEEKAMYSAELEKHKREKGEWRSKALRLEDQASALQVNLDEANAALDSASRLTDQLDLKEELIEELKTQVNVRQEMLEEAQRKLMNLLNSTEGKIDKVLMRNLFLGYFHTPKTKRADVLRLMGSVLGLSREDVDKMLEDDGRHGVTGWVSTWLGGRGAQSVPNTPQRPTSGPGLNSSFSEMFVKFLEMESTPTLPAPKLPYHDIMTLSPPPSRKTSGSSAPSAGAAAAGRRPAGESNPFLAPRSAAVPLLAGSGSGGSAGHLLMKPISDTLPAFTPVPVSAEASGGAVLKDLLQQ